MALREDRLNVVAPLARAPTAGAEKQVLTMSKRRTSRSLGKSAPGTERRCPSPEGLAGRGCGGPHPYPIYAEKSPCFYPTDPLPRAAGEGDH